MNKRGKGSIILTSLGAIAIAGTLLTSATYALFTSESKANIATVSGKVNVEAYIDEGSLKTYSGVNISGDTKEDADKITETEVIGVFTNKGTAKINGDTLTLDKMTPGDKVTFNIVVKNNSNVKILYRTILSFIDQGLFEGLSVTVNEEVLTSNNLKSSYEPLEVGSSDIVIPVVIEMPTDKGNEYQDKSCSISFTVEAIQRNVSVGVYTVNPETVQNTLDIVGDDATIVLEEGDYDTLYLRQSLKKSSRRSDLDINTNDYPAYYREFNGLTIKVADGATVTCKGILAEAGTFYYSTDPASNQAAMNRAESGFVSYLSLNDVTIQGITFSDTTQNAVYLKDNSDVAYVNGSSLLVDNLTIKDCSATGDNSNSSVHFFSAGTNTSSSTFLDTNKTALNNINLISNELKEYVEPIYMDNSTALLNNLTITGNIFDACLGDIIQVKNKETSRNIVISDNSLNRPTGRFALIENVTSDAVVTLYNNTMTIPAGYASDGSVVKVTGATGFSVTDEGNDWTVGNYTDTNKTTWVANGDTSKVVELITIDGENYSKSYETGFENVASSKLITTFLYQDFKTVKSATAKECDGIGWKGKCIRFFKTSSGNFVKMANGYETNGGGGYLMTTENFTEEMDAIQFNYSTSDTAAVFDVQYSLDDGSTWTTIGTFTGSAGLKQFKIGSTISNCRIRFLLSSSNYDYFVSSRQKVFMDFDNITFLKKQSV